MTDESALYTLATRLLPRRTARAKAGQANLQLLAGRLPAGLPFELPVPAGCRIMGSAVEGHFAKIVLDTDLTPKEVIEFYRNELTRDNWSMLATRRSRGGFEFANHSHGVFCASPAGPKLILNAHADPGAPTEVRLDLDLTPNLPCEHPGTSHPPHPGPIPSLPELAPPAGAILQPAGGEASPLGTSANAQLITPLDLASVAAHYASQMRQAGCVERDHGQGDVLAWSTWDLDHPDYGASHGLVLVVQQPNDHTQYFLYLRVARAAADSQPSAR